MKTEQFEDILVYFSKSLLGKENENEILWDLAKNCIAKLGFVDCVIYLVDKGNKFLVQKAAYGPKSPKDDTVYNPVQIILGKGITGHVAVSGKAEIIADTSKDVRYIEDDEFRLSEICVPIVYEDTIYGVIDCEHPEKGFFTEQHLKMLSAVASICAIKIRSVRANKALLGKERRLLKVKEEMVELKLRALNSQLNPHFVFNALNAIQSFITSQKKKLALEYLSVFSKLIRFYLKHLKSDKVLLLEEIDMLRGYLKLQKLRYGNKFEFELSMESDSKMGEALIPYFVIQTLLENLIERAIYYQYKDQYLRISFWVSEENVTVKVHHQYEKNSLNLAYKPDYRQDIINWQDQIRLLNAGKNYGIQKEITTTNGSEHILIRLPNLK